MSTEGTMLGRAIAIAASAHAKQADKGGKAYILHPLRVMAELHSNDEELNCIAVLHDSVEDSNGAVTISSLRAEGFSERVCGCLAILTHDKNEDYDVYVRRCAMKRDTARVKKADIKDNCDVTRLKGLRDKDFERMEKYHRAFVFLTKALEAMEAVGY